MSVFSMNLKAVGLGVTVAVYCWLTNIAIEIIEVSLAQN